MLRILLLSVCLAASAAHGQSDSLRTYFVRDALTGRAIADCEILPQSPTTKWAVQLSDSRGLFRIFDSFEGQISFFKEGYVAQLIETTDPRRVIDLRPLTIPLGAAEVTAWERRDEWVNLTSETAVLPPALIAQGDQSGLTRAMNFIPGVRMDERGNGGSRRFGIRGSMVRSAFGVRGVRFYRNGFGLTGPDGTTSMELIDPDELQTVSVIKAPAGGLYGPNLAGVVLLESKRPVLLSQRFDTDYTAGSDGYSRGVVSANIGAEKWALRVGLVKQDYEGYRQQEWNYKQQAILDFRSEISTAATLLAYYTHYNGAWALSGSLNEEEVREDPRQARPFAVDNNTRVSRIHNYAGIGLDLRGDRLDNQTRIWFHGTQKENPYGVSPFFNGYKDEEAYGSGLRSVFDLALYRADSSSLKLLFGFEAQWEQYAILENELKDGFPGQTKYLLDMVNAQAMFFSELQWTYRTIRINAGAGLQTARFAGEGSSSALNQPLNQTFTYPGTLSPGIRMLWQASPEWSISAVHNRGASLPDLFELIDVSTGYFNPDLRSEEGHSTEFGVRSDLAFMRLSLSVFRTDYLRLIVAEVDSEERYSYRNLGRSQNEGAELMASFLLLDSERLFPVRLSLDLSAAAHRFIYRNRDEDLMEPLAGIPPHTLNSAFRAELFRQFTLWAVHRYNDYTPLHFGLPERSAPAYHVLDLQLQWQGTYGRWQPRAHAGLNNATDTQYTSFFALNNPQQRYYNPAPGRNWFAGVGVGYLFR